MERTFAIIKPDAVAAGQSGEIISIAQKAGFRVVGMKMKRLSQLEAEGFYAVHRERPFYASLVKFMTEGPVVVMVLGAPDAGLQLYRANCYVCHGENGDQVTGVNFRAGVRRASTDEEVSRIISGGIPGTGMP